MLLLYITFSCVLFGSAADLKYEQLCYGRSFRLPFDYTPPAFLGKLYFSLSNGGSSKLVMDKGETKDPRLQVFKDSVNFTMTERDGGTFSVSFGDNRPYNVITLKIWDCTDWIRRHYGDTYHCDVPRQAEFLEFTQVHSLDQPKVWWNRTDPQTNKGGRGQVKGNVWKIMNLTQADNGFYSFRGKDTILSTIQLIVKEYSRYYKPKENKRLLMQYPADFALWNVTFMPKEEMGPQTVMTAGNLVTEDDTSVKPWHFSGRIRVVPDGIEINPITGTDSGTFEFRDPQGNLAQTVKVVVKQESTFSNVFTGTIFGVVLAVSACCYCLKKCCCCCKRSSKRAQTVAAPAVYSHGENQPADSSCSAADYSDQPMDLLNSGEPEINSLGTLVYNIVNIYENPPQPEVAPLGGQGATPTLSIGFDCLSSDPDPEFELKGLIFSSAPLSSDTTFCDVYTSEKLNFLKGVD